MSVQNFGLIKAIFVQSTPPTNTNVLWRDTTVNRTKEYDPTVPGWVALNANAGTVNWGNIGGVLSSQTDLNTQLTNLQTSINTNLTSINTINANITSIQGDVTTIQGQITTLQSQVHTQGTDQGLDTGGTNAVTALEIRTFIDSKAQNGGLASLDSGGKIPLIQIPDSIRTSLQFQGMWNASSNTPTLASGIGTQGHYYIVSTPGGTDLDGETDWDTGDWAIFDGTTWSKVDNSERVTQVNGQTGIVTLTTSNVSEGTNLYYTEARVNANTNVAANTSARHNRNEDQFTLPNVSSEAQLRLISTLNLSIGTHIMYRASVSGELFIYILASGTDIDDSPNTIRPDDYVDTTNEKIWLRALAVPANQGLLTASNGLNVDGADVRIGGPLTETLTQVTANTLQALRFEADGIGANHSLRAFNAGVVDFTISKSTDSTLVGLIATENGENSTFAFRDSRNTTTGITYEADYSSGLGTLSLIHRGFADSNYLSLTAQATGANLWDSLNVQQYVNPAGLRSYFSATLFGTTLGQFTIPTDFGGGINWRDSTNLIFQVEPGVLDVLGSTWGQLRVESVSGNAFLNLPVGSDDFGFFQSDGTTLKGIRTAGLNGLIYPTGDGTNGQSLVTDGAGNLSFASVGGITPRDAGNGLTLNGNALDLGGTLASSVSINVASTSFNFTSIAQSLGISSTGLTLGNVANAVLQSDEALTVRSGSGGALNVLADTILNLSGDTSSTLATDLATVGNSGFIQITSGQSTNGSTGSVDIATGTAQTTSGNITIGTGSATGNRGNVIIQGLTYPIADGTNGQVLTTNGSGILSFATVAGGGITNSAANNEIPVSDGTNLVGSGITRLVSGPDIFLRSISNQLTIVTGDASSTSTVNLILTTTAQNNPGDVSILTGNGSGVGNASGNITIRPGSGNSGATRGNLTLDTLNWPLSDGTNGQALITDGAGNLSFASVGGITPRDAGNGLTLNGNALDLGGTLASSVSINVASTSFNFTSIAQSLGISSTGLTLGNVANAVLQSDEALTVRSGSGGALNVLADTILNLSGDTSSTLATDLATVGNSGFIQITSGQSTNGSTGSVDIATGTAQTTSGNITIGTGSATGNRGNVIIQGLTYPIADGTNGQVLTTNGSGILSFATVAGGGITNSAANNEIPVSDGTNLVGSGITRLVSGPDIFLRSISNQLTIVTGDASSTSTVNLILTTTAQNNPGDVSILTGNGSGVGNASGNITIRPGSGNSGATRGNLTLDTLNWPLSDGTNGQALITDGAGNLSFGTIAAGITNSAANGEIPVSDGTNLISSALNATLSAGEVNLTGARALFNIFSNLGGAVTITTQASAASTGLLTLSTGSVSGVGNTSGNIAMSTGIAASEDSGAISVTTGNAFNNSGDISIVTGDVNNAGQASGDVIIASGAAGGSATKGNVTINGINWPTADGGANHSLITDGNGNLSFAMVTGTIITASNGITLVGSDVRLGGNVTNTTTIVASQALSVRSNTASGSVGMRALGGSSLELVVDIGSTTFVGFQATENGQSSTFQFIDSKTTPTGLVYAADYRAGFTDRSLVDKAYVDPGTPAQRITALTSTTNATSIDFQSGSRFREFSFSLAENTTISFTNALSRSSYKIFLNITGASRTITLPSSVKMPASTSNITGVTWTTGTKALILPVGEFELAGDFDGTTDFIKMTDAYE